MKWEIAWAIFFAFNGFVLEWHAWTIKAKPGAEAIVVGCIVFGALLIGLAGGLLA